MVAEKALKLHFKVFKETPEALKSNQITHVSPVFCQVNAFI